MVADVFRSDQGPSSFRRFNVVSQDIKQDIYAVYSTLPAVGTQIERYKFQQNVGNSSVVRKTSKTFLCKTADDLSHFKTKIGQTPGVSTYTAQCMQRLP